jgi:hypothetical protein
LKKILPNIFSRRKFPPKASKFLSAFSGLYTVKRPSKFIFKKEFKKDKVKSAFQGDEKSKESTLFLTFNVVEITGSK